MSNVNGTFLCGCEGTVSVTGTAKEREYRAEWLFRSRLCDVCKMARREEELERAKIEETELSLPALKGSEKQIAWATALRMASIKNRKSYLKYIEDSHADEIFFYEPHNLVRQTVLDATADFERTLERFFTECTDASLYIESRSDSSLVKNAILYVADKNRESITTNKLEPVAKKHDGVVILGYRGDYVYCLYDNDEEFKNICKANKFKWLNNNWLRELDEYLISFENYIAYLANIFVENGFAVIIEDNETYKLAKEKTFIVPTKRWATIKRFKRITIVIPKGDKEVADAVANLSGGTDFERYEISPFVYENSVDISTKYYKEIREFLQKYNYNMSERVIERLNESEMKYNEKQS